MKIGNVEFFSKTEYMAGLRDSGRIELLKKQTDINNPLAAAALFRELKNQPFYFETAVGKEFMKELVRKTRPSDRGVGVGIRRDGYRATEEEEERIRAYEESRKAKMADYIRIIENDAEEYDRYGDFVYDENEVIPGRRPMRTRSVRDIDYARNYGMSRSYRTQFAEQETWNDSYIETKTEKNDKKSKKAKAKKKVAKEVSEKTNSKTTSAATKKKKREQRRSLLLLAGIMSALLLGYCVTGEMSYRIKSFASEKKMEALQNSVLQPMEIAKDDEPVMERVAMAGNDNVVMSDSMRQPEPIEEHGILPEYADLYEKNDDLVGWIRIPGTKINYPVMQTKDDMEYYLHRDFDGDEDVNGLPFLDARCDVNKPSTNLLIYGHSMSSGAMFAGLMDYKNYEFYQEHKTIYFDTMHERGEYEVVAVFQSRVAYVDEVAFRYYNFIQADTQTEFDSFISAVTQLSYYDTGIEASYGDRLLTLSTCDREITDGRLVVLARKCD